MKGLLTNKFLLKCKAINNWLYLLPLVLLLQSCSVSSRINRQAKKMLYSDSVIASGHIGISVYEPASGNQWYSHNATKYFTPASNTKLFTLYAALKYLQDSLVGLRYRQQGDSTLIYPAADPTLLHPDFVQQPVIAFLKTKTNIRFQSQLYQQHLANGWAWEDYQERYMPQRSELPLYGNMMTVYFGKDSVTTQPAGASILLPYENGPYNANVHYQLKRDWETNQLLLLPGHLQKERDDSVTIPIAAGIQTMPRLLGDTLQRLITFGQNDDVKNNDKQLLVVHSRPTDSMLKPMLHYSDNFFAEQALLMASNEVLGFMNANAIIDSLLKHTLSGVPQVPRWVDGSGLSRYNLFTPQSFTWILEKLQLEFGIERIKRLLPTGGEGTLEHFFIADSGFIFAKTGTLGGTIALSGFVITNKNRVLAFSVLTNNFKGSATRVRRRVEGFVTYLRRQF